MAEHQNMAANIVILGSTGFLGQYLYENFSKDNKYAVLGFSPPDIDLTSPASTAILRNAIDRDTVMIMAASALAKEKSYSAFQKEIAMVVNVAHPDLIANLKQVILISSTAIYGHHAKTAIKESSPPLPDDLYSLAKYVSELMFQRVCHDHNIPLTIVRPGILYGPGDVKSPLYRFVSKVRAGQPIELHGDGSTRLVWLHVNDAWRAMQIIVENGMTGDYNIISDGNGTSLTQLAETVFSACGEQTGITYVPSSKISPDLHFDLSKFANAFPRFTFTSLLDGMRDYKVQ